MGAITSRQHAGVEEIDIISNHAYKYPPRSGNYFGTHFIMGGERFDTPQPESYLFGENADLNFLGSRPTPFPYPPPQPNEPTKTLKSLVNIRKESLRFVRAPIDYSKSQLDHGQGDVELGKSSTFNIEFTFDSDVRCSITIYYFCTEDYNSSGVTYASRDPVFNSETFHYKRGANQQFCQMSHIFDPSKFNEDDLLYDMDRDVIPIAIHCVAEEGPDDMRQSHTTIAAVDKMSDGTFALKALKQKLFVDGLCYLLQEIYGIENKSSDKPHLSTTSATVSAGAATALDLDDDDDDDGEDNGSECVICMCDVRDTLILPCRHLCLCNACADSLRYQANNCPICRAPFRALLQIRALQKTVGGGVLMAPVLSPDGNCENIPPGYEAVSLIEALNGPCMPRAPASIMPDLVETPINESALQAAQILNRQDNRLSKSKERESSAPDFGMSVLLSRDDDGKETPKCPLLSDITSTRTKQGPKMRDTVLHINEKPEKNEITDEDSEAEKLSPLLENNILRNCLGGLTLNMVDVDPIDDTDDDHDEPNHKSTIKLEKPKSAREERSEESDYYTPEDPQAPVVGPTLYDTNTPLSTNNGGSLVEGATPQHYQQRLLLPGTPQSHAISAESYVSSNAGSAKHLLARGATGGGGGVTSAATVVENGGGDAGGAVNI